jgi:uncharacterized membrane protein
VAFADDRHHGCHLLTLYVNSDDDRSWVPEPIGMGRTLNYVRLAAYWITALILLFVGALLYLSLHTGLTRSCCLRG